ncbi:thioesterase family protein [Sedimenticola selenatireducens]|jgi:predicted thioesterase|uniref:LysR family transcriptional regulator n=1 Tax=Sedimenticola selenatireducens TaxID=191960 RepID=A0A558DXL7_9GAMM|nr:LysR family transcriptional regulator [Sedimenticola selenatireducens]TVO70955.1 LysR family transcriptional regulator [Sedimenticola selenatireducens]TVT65821.1 MAG: LysR family transcriptional regulator [Sedimenticola selenatireducens]
MKESLQAGLTKTDRYEIDKPRTVNFVGDDCAVYSTPSLIYDMEVTSRNLLLEHLDASEDSVGTRVEMDHTGATLLGMWVEITATIVEVKGRMVSYEFTARDAMENVAKGKHVRFVVDTAQTAERLKAKAAKATS